MLGSVQRRSQSMTDLATIVTMPRIQSRIRDVMRKSPVHRLDDQLPERLATLLRQLEEAEATRH